MFSIYKCSAQFPQYIHEYVTNIQQTAVLSLEFMAVKNFTIHISLWISCRRHWVQMLTRTQKKQNPKCNIDILKPTPKNKNKFPNS